MQYTENQINEYLQEYFCFNSDAIKDRLRFLLELHVEAAIKTYLKNSGYHKPKYPSMVQMKEKL